VNCWRAGYDSDSMSRAAAPRSGSVIVQSASCSPRQNTRRAGPSTQHYRSGYDGPAPKNLSPSAASYPPFAICAKSEAPTVFANATEIKRVGHPPRVGNFACHPQSHLRERVEIMYPPVANKTRQGGATTLPLAKQNGRPAPEWASHFHYRGLRICTREVHGAIFAGGDIIRGEYIVDRFLGRTTKVAVARTVFPQRPLYPSITVLGGIDSIIELFF
jgi:hypothetical protein